MEEWTTRTAEWMAAGTAGTMTGTVAATVAMTMTGTVAATVAMTMTGMAETMGAAGVAVVGQADP